jgi:DNA-binding MarR family transcriptional regulator
MGAEFDPEASLGHQVNRAARAMAAALGRRLQRHGVSIGQWAVLLFLYQRDGQSQAELSRRVAIEPPTLVRTLDRMERDKFVERRPDARDARVTRVHLTEKARLLRHALFAEARAVNASVEQALGRERAAALRDDLALVSRALASSQDEE